MGVPYPKVPVTKKGDPLRSPFFNSVHYIAL
jgi:hypothetical protein